MNLEQRISILEKKLKLTEKNALQAYFSEHPEKVREFGISSDVSWRDVANQIFRTNPINDKYYQLLTKFEEKYPWSFKSIYLHLGAGAFDRVLSFSDPLELFKKGYSYEYSKNPKDFDDYFNKLAKDPDLRKLRSLYDKKSDYAEIKFKQLANQYGINLRDLAFGFNEIIRMQSSSYQKLKPSSYALLKAMTVVPSQLPSVIYRGFFYDGAKIKDQDKFLKQWAVGNSPKVKLGKPTSWSSSKSVAIGFMKNQDKVKNAEDGYHVLLKIKNPTEDEVIGDLRNFEFSRFWNQQEIIISPEVTRYTVEELLPYQEYNAPDNKYRDLEKSNMRPGAGSWGRNKNELLMDIFNLSKYDISLNTKIDYKEIKDLTIGELIKRKMLSSEYFDDEYKSKHVKLLLPLFKFATQPFIGRTSIFKVNSPTSIIMSSQINFKNIEYKDTVGKTFEGTGLISKEKFGNDAIIALLTEVNLVQNNINKFVFDFKFIEYQLVYSEKSHGEEIVKYLETKNPIFEELFLKEIHKIENLFPTVKINVK